MIGLGDYLEHVAVAAERVGGCRPVQCTRPASEQPALRLSGAEVARESMECGHGPFSTLHGWRGQLVNRAVRRKKAVGRGCAIKVAAGI